MKFSKLRLLRFVSLRNVFVGTCDMFLALPGKVEGRGYGVGWVPETPTTLFRSTVHTFDGISDERLRVCASDQAFPTNGAYFRRPSAVCGMSFWQTVGTFGRLSDERFILSGSPKRDAQN